MRLNTKERDVIKSQEFKTINYGVDTSNLPLLFQMLRTNLYGDLYGSIIRELVSNVVDSHMEADKPDAVGEVEWVDANRGLGIDCQLIIRDFGVGLSPERMETVYGNYLSSTKRDSNTGIGGFGLGSKVPFAYSDSFFVKTVYDGVMTMYLCYIDKTQLGAISVLEVRESELENQTEVIIPIKDYSHRAPFQAAIKRQLAYFRNIRYINIEGPDQEILFENEECIILANPPIIGIHVLVGPVAYSIPGGELSKVYSRFSPSNYQCDIGVKLPIGAVQPTLSREDLFWTEDTIKIISNKLKKVSKEMSDILEEKLEKETDYGRWYGVISSHGTKELPHVWPLANLTARTFEFNTSGGPLVYQLYMQTWFQNQRLRTVRSEYSGTARVYRNADYVVKDSSYEEIRDLPAYSLAAKLDPRIAMYLLRKHPDGFIVVGDQPPGTYRRDSKYADAAAEWRNSLPVFDDIKIPKDEPLLEELKAKERALKEKLLLRKLEGKYTAKQVVRNDGAFLYRMYEGKFEVDKDLRIIYGFQEDSETLLELARFLCDNAEFRKGLDSIKTTFLLLKIGKQHVRQFEAMPDAAHVGDVINLKSSWNSLMADISTAWRIRPWLMSYNILTQFGDINKEMTGYFYELFSFVKSNAKGMELDQSRLRFLGYNQNNYNADIEKKWEAIVSYFEGIELLTFPQVAIFSDCHETPTQRSLAVMQGYVDRNKASIIALLQANGKAIDSNTDLNLIPAAPVIDPSWSALKTYWEETRMKSGEVW